MLHRVTLPRWIALLFIVGLLVRLLHPRATGVPFWYWLRLRGRNYVLTHALRPISTRLEAMLIAMLAPTLSAHGLLHQFGLPSLWQTVIGVLLLDLSFYVRHRLDHGVPILWRVHRVHHSDPDIDVTTTGFSHPFSGPMRIVWQGLSIALLGIPTSAAAIYLVVEGYQGYLNHSGLVFEPLDRLMRRCGFISPLNHQTHHARDLPATDSNFGTILSVWDHLFGTYRYVPPSEIRCGLAAFDEPRSQTIYGLLVSPFRNLEPVGTADLPEQPAYVPAVRANA